MTTAKDIMHTGYPGVDIKSHGCNVFTPGTLRIKYGGLGYDVVFDELDRLPLLDDDEEGTVEFVDWVAELLAASVKTKARNTSGGAKEWARRGCYARVRSWVLSPRSAPRYRGVGCSRSA